MKFNLFLGTLFFAASNANNLAVGIVPEARLSNNVALLNRPIQAFTGATNSFSGNVGIGTTTPQSKLQVIGDIKLGTSGQLFAPAGEENLRIVRGSVSSTGTIVNGAGFTASRIIGATYQVTFNTAFSSNPSIVVSCGAAGQTINSQDVATVESASTSSFTVKIGVRNIGYADEPFSFIAIALAELALIITPFSCLLAYEPVQLNLISQTGCHQNDLVRLCQQLQHTSFILVSAHQLCSF